ncbi:LPXTG cell wall anchor domain-containing protein [Streptococcus didelphis]|nr:LPXTG cell wall anchor domain-containing protein [Streptococcus didelphis]
MPENPENPQLPESPELPLAPEKPESPKEMPKEAPKTSDSQPQLPEAPKTSKKADQPKTEQKLQAQTSTVKNLSTAQTSTSDKVQNLNAQEVPNQTKASQLPATGDKTNPFFTAAAMLIMAGAGSLGFLPQIKRK